MLRRRLVPLRHQCHAVDANDGRQHFPETQRHAFRVERTVFALALSIKDLPRCRQKGGEAGPVSPLDQGKQAVDAGIAGAD